MCIGLVFLPYPGLQNDEVLFAAPFFRTWPTMYNIYAGQYSVPMMLLPYLGALKTLLYTPVFAIWPPGVLSIRLPVLLFGAATVALLYPVLRLLHSRAAAVIGTALLATDPVFLLTTCFDWGPVALQHFLFVAGLLLFLLWVRFEKTTLLAAASFSCGLTLWDKALSLWLLSGLTLSTILFYWRPARSRLTPAAALVVCSFVVLGSLPLIAYNVYREMPTWAAPSGYTSRELWGKSTVLGATLDGSVLFSYLVKNDNAPQPRRPGTSLERAAFGLHRFSGATHRTLLPLALLTALLIAPFPLASPARRMLLFLFVAGACAWLEMGITQGAGAAAHHTILLWPLPQMVIAIAFAQLWTARQISIKVLVNVFFVVAVLSNCLVTNQYFYQFVRDGPAGSWTDAIFPLSSSLPASNGRAAVLDWGILDCLTVLHEGRLGVIWAADPLLQKPPQLPAPSLLRDRNVWWIRHTDGNEQFAGVNAALRDVLARGGYSPRDVKVIRDRNGRPVFEVFRLAP